MDRRRGFSLVELLVVIGILTVLAALLLPAMRAAREQAWQVQCMSNIRQVTQAYLVYTQERDGLFLLCDSPVLADGLGGSPAN